MEELDKKISEIVRSTVKEFMVSPERDPVLLAIVKNVIFFEVMAVPSQRGKN
jgi:hypothetical protein